MPEKEIEELKDHFVAELKPERVYLFGSFATGSYTDQSDLDFYIVMSDATSDLPQTTAQAYHAIRGLKRHPVDIIVGRKSRFEKRKTLPSIENEVYKKGVLLYESGDQAVV